MSPAELVYRFLSDCAAFKAIVTDVAEAEAGREFTMPFSVFQQRTSTPMNSLRGFQGVTLHSFNVAVIDTDPDRAARAIQSLRAYFNPANAGAVTWPYRPAGWVSGDPEIQGGYIRDGSTDDAPDVVTEQVVATPTVNLDLWITS